MQSVLFWFFVLFFNYSAYLLFFVDRTRVQLNRVLKWLRGNRAFVSAKPHFVTDIQTPLPQVYPATIPSPPACATERSSSSPSTPWRPRRCTRPAAAPTTTTNRSPTRTSSRASCDASTDGPRLVSHTHADFFFKSSSEGLKVETSEKPLRGRHREALHARSGCTADYFSV